MKPPADARTPENRVVPLPAAEHAELMELLPWYVTGRLDAAEQASVQAHLAGCRRCREEAAFHRRLGAEVAALPLEAEHGWAQMRRQIENEAVAPWRRILRRLSAKRGWLVAGGALATAALAVAVFVPTAVPAPERPQQVAQAGAYRTLGAAETRPVGEIVVVFRPDAAERQVLAALKASGARVVDGPTATDAYVLDAPAGQRDRALDSLRGSGVVTLAEPLAVGPDR